MGLCNVAKLLRNARLVFDSVPKIVCRPLAAFKLLPPPCPPPPSFPPPDASLFFVGLGSCPDSGLGCGLQIRWWIEGEAAAAACFGTETDERAVVSFKFHFAVSLLCNIIFVVLFRIKLITQKQKHKKKQKQKQKCSYT